MPPAILPLFVFDWLLSLPLELEAAVGTGSYVNPQDSESGRVAAAGTKDRPLTENAGSVGRASRSRIGPGRPAHEPGGQG
jgi:hypothetical protein